MTLQGLTDIRRQLADLDVLSTYISAEEHDPTERLSWRTRLDSQLDRMAQRLEGDARERFAGARRNLEQALRPVKGFLPGRGWAAFVTADRVWAVGEVPAPMPDLVRWRRGPVLGPYLRALKQSRAVLLVLVDQRRARLLRYQAGVLTEFADYRADAFIDDLTDRTTVGRGGTHSGMRGETASDAADRILRQETERLMKQVAKEMRPGEGDGLIIIAGSTPAVATLQKLVAPAAGERLMVEPAMHLTMSLPELQDAVEAAASSLSRRIQASRVESLFESAGPGGSGVMGLQALAAACALGQVERLFVTAQFLNDQEDAAERLIGETLEHGGAVELVGDDAATLLDSAGGGAGARLRYTVKEAAAV